MSVGKRIKRLREDLRLTQEDVANKVGVAIQTIYKYENEIVTNIPLDKLEKIATALSTSPSYLMGWDNKRTISTEKFPAPSVTESYTKLPILGDIAAGFDHIASEDWEGDTLDIPDSYLKGRPASDFFVLRVKGDSMYPMYQDGDKVLIKKQSALDYSGEIGAILYDDDYATLKKIEFVTGEDWLRLVPVNPNVPPVTISGEDLMHCRIIGVPRLLIRDINQL